MGGCDLIAAGGYIARPWQDEGMAQNAWKMAYMLHHAAKHNAFFSDYVDAADRVPNILRDLQRPDTLLWEVHNKALLPEPLAFVGILRLTDVRPGEDALAHYFFFDRRLADKTPLLQAWADWCFTEQDGWRALHRISVEVPAYMHALAAHARRHLGMRDEGIRREAHAYEGARYDKLLLGKLREEHAGRTE